MATDRMMLMIGRLEMLTDELDRLARKCPEAGNLPRGGIRAMFVTDEDRDLEATMERLGSEVVGLIASIADVFKAYGIDIRNEAVAGAFTKAPSAAAFASALRRASGALRAKALLLP